MDGYPQQDAPILLPPAATVRSGPAKAAVVTGGGSARQSSRDWRTFHSVTNDGSFGSDWGLFTRGCLTRILTPVAVCTPKQRSARPYVEGTHDGARPCPLTIYLAK